MQIGHPVVSGNSSRKLWPKFAGIRILALVSLDGQDRDINYWAKPRPVVSAEVLAIDQLELQAEVLTLQRRRTVGRTAEWPRTRKLVSRDFVPASSRGIIALWRMQVKRRTRSFRSRHTCPLLDQLRVPVRRVGQVEKGQPLAVANAIRASPEGRRPARPGRYLEQPKMGLFERAGTLRDVAVHTAADHVVPGRPPAARAWNHVIQIQPCARQLAAAVLAGVVVARVDVVTGKAHLGARDAVVDLQQDHARQQHLP